MAFRSHDRISILAIGGRLAVTLALLLTTTPGWARVQLPERNPVREGELPLPERNPLRQGELPLPTRNPLRIVPEAGATAKQEKRGMWPKLLPGTPQVLKTWSEEETNAERARCAAVLKDIHAEIEPATPVRNGGCGAAGPIKLISLGKATKVSVSPPATMTCDLVVALAHWMEKDVQPAAQRLLGKTVTRISNISDYSCRNAVSRSSTRLSEHALANALDIRDFITADGEVVDLKRDWGPTARDIVAQIAAEKAAEAARRAAAAAAKAAAERSKAKVGDPKAGSKANPKSDLKIATTGDLEAAAKDEKTAESTAPLSPRERRRLKRAERQKARETARAAAKEAARLAREKPAGPLPVSATMAATAAKPGTRGQFLREIHGAACGTFGTVLGPEANEAHRDHFHLDMAKRRYKSFCE